jgi:hypothetical protein
MIEAINLPKPRLFLKRDCSLGWLAAGAAAGSSGQAQVQYAAVGAVSRQNRQEAGPGAIWLCRGHTVWGCMGGCGTKAEQRATDQKTTKGGRHQFNV